MAEAPKRRRAGAYLRGDQIIIFSYAHTIDGIGISVPPARRLAASADPVQVGAALRQALIPPLVVPPRFWKDQQQLSREFLKSAGFRSFRQLESAARYCSIEATNGEVVVEPYRNGGTRGDKKGFQPFGAVKGIALEAADDGVLGAALRDGLHRAE